MPSTLPTVVILCGGRGTRLQENSSTLPKPLMKVGGRPIVWHVISMYRAHGFRRFLLLTGYRASQVAAFVAAEPWSRDVRVTCLDTGSDTPTGERVRLAAPRLDEERFCLAYADGVADSEEWVNAGFFCFERAALEVLEPGSVLEREPLERLAAAGQLRAFRHVGFWECMDTHKDWITLNALWEGGRALWSPIRPDEASPAPRTLRAAQPQLN